MNTLFKNVSGRGRVLVGDTENNGLLLTHDKNWLIAYIDRNTKEIFVFTDQYVEPTHKYRGYVCGSIKDGVRFGAESSKLTVHNMMGYDWWIFNSISPEIWNITTCPPWSPKLQDTLVQSRVQWYDRPCPRGYKGTHGLAAWGYRVGVPKPEIDDWTTWSQAMLTRVVDDIRINDRVADALDAERAELISIGVDTVETYERCKQTQFWQTQQEINGWLADQPKMRHYVDTFTEAANKLAAEIEPLLPKKVETSGKITNEEFMEKWNNYVEEMKKIGITDLRRLLAVPPTRYDIVEIKGEATRRARKKLVTMTTSFLNSGEINGYVIKNLENGDVYGHVHPKIKEARDAMEQAALDKKVWKVVKQTHFGVKGYNANLCKYFGIQPEDWFDPHKQLVGGAFSRISFSDTRMSQDAIVKRYLLEKCGWLPDEYNIKKDRDNKAYKAVADKDGNLVKYNPKKHSAYQYVTHDDVDYLLWDQTFKKFSDLRPSVIQTSPKLTESSYDTIEGDLGEKIATYNTLMHRVRTLENPSNEEKGWLNLIREDGRLSAGASVFATSTGRMAQYGIVNVPSGSAKFGKPMREVWTCEKGTTLLSADMNSAQLVLLANFMGDEAFTYAVTKGKEFIEVSEEDYDGQPYYKHDKENHFYEIYSGTDAHTMNSVAFGLNTQEDIEKARLTQDHDLIDKITKGRKIAKNCIYALLFGAGDEKFARTAKKRTAAEGKAIKETYFKRLPKLRALLDRLEQQWRKHKWKRGGYIRVAGAWLFCKSSHKLLNYLLMGSEASVQNEAVNLANRKLVENGWTKLNGLKPAVGVRWVCSYHDEATVECPEDIAMDVKREVCDWKYGQASKNLGLHPDTLVTGTAKVGYNWLDVH